MAETNIDTTLMTVGQPTEGGCVYVSFDTSTALPTDAKTKISTLTGFESVGDISENGFTESRDISSTDVKDWGGSTVATLIESDQVKYQVELLEVNRGTSAKLRYGQDAVTVGDDGSVKVIKYKQFAGKPVVLVIDELESNGALRRTVVKNAVINSFDDIAHQKGSLMVYGMTFNANTPADGSEPVVVYRDTVESV
jgi:hypothetical protein